MEKSLPEDKSKSVAERDVEKLGLELAESTPAGVRADLYAVAGRAAESHKEPYQLAYPWVDVRLWYNPARYPEVYLAHWRYWNACRPIFWRCALHPPVAPGAPQTKYRKQKMRACRTRLKFLSLCVETWGFVAFLDLLHAGGSRLIWLGGRPGRHSSKVPKGSGELDQSLGTLYFTDRARYKRRIEAALDPAIIDREGYLNVVELLEQSAALDPEVRKASRLTDGALARVRADWVNSKRFRSSWKTEGLVAAYEKLRDHQRIAGLKVQDQLRVPSIQPFDEKETEHAGFAPFKNKNGSCTALSPTSGGIVVYPTPNAASKIRVTKSLGNSPVSTPAEVTPASKSEGNSPSVKASDRELFGEEDSSDSDDSDDEDDEEESSEKTVTDGKSGASSDEGEASQEEEDEEKAPAAPTASPTAISGRTRSAFKST